MHEQQMLAGDFLRAPVYNILGWTEDESTSVPDAASEVSPLAKLMLVVVRAGPWKG